MEKKYSVFSSSADPTKFSQTVKGVLTFLVAFGAFFGIDNSQIELGEVSNAVVSFALLVGEGIGILMFLRGAWRKVKLKKWN